MPEMSPQEFLEHVHRATSTRPEAGAPPRRRPAKGGETPPQANPFEDPSVTFDPEAYRRGASRRLTFEAPEDETSQP